MDHLFVYGTLQPGGPNEHVLSHVNGTWQPASVAGRLAQQGWGADLGYPALILDDSAQRVKGVVLASAELDKEWAALDAFEGSEYQRVLTDVFLDGGEQTRAYVYVLRTDHE
ncbi:MAG: gamma-glutamylcyclotransferase family protein [Pseudomonadota bacterium]